jgi:hypothetical protein
LVTNIRERLTMNKQMQIFLMKRFNLKKLNEGKGKEKYCVEVSNRSAALEYLGAEVEINSAWETLKRKYQNFSQRESKLL